jgi:hypothetical protein
VHALEEVLERNAERGRRHDGQHEQPDLLRLGRPPALAKRGERAARHGEEIGPEVEDHGHERAEMKCDVERDVRLGIAPAEPPVREREVGRRRDGKEFAESLEETEDAGLNGSHGGRT